jgi:hypothetical protein
MLRARRQVEVGGEAPTWPRFGDGEAPRVLIEHPDPAAQRFLADAFRRRGFDTLTCGGPTAQGAASVSCPLLTEGACPAVDGADVVVSSLQVNQGYEGRVVRAIVEDPTAPPLLLEATTWQLSQVELSDAVADRCFPFASPSQVVDRAVMLLAAA